MISRTKYDLDLEKFAQGQNFWNILIKENCHCMGGTVFVGGGLHSPSAFLVNIIIIVIVVIIIIIIILLIYLLLWCLLG